MVTAMAEKRRGKQTAPAGTDKPADQGGKKFTTLRVYTETSDQLSQLAKLRKKSIHDLIKEMFADRLDHELIAATEDYLRELKARKAPRAGA